MTLHDKLALAIGMYAASRTVAQARQSDEPMRAEKLMRLYAWASARPPPYLTSQAPPELSGGKGLEGWDVAERHGLKMTCSRSRTKRAHVSVPRNGASWFGGGFCALLHKQSWNNKVPSSHY